MNEIINTTICGDALSELKKISDESIDCVITSPPYFGLRFYLDKNDKNKKLEIGLESTYQEYINNLILIFNEVKRVLKKEGTCFVNLGDTYGGSGGYNGNKGLSKSKYYKDYGSKQIGGRNIIPKSLLLIPQRFAIKMLENNWLLRNDLIWIKKSAMPESVNDRWKKAHEHIFFFTKKKKYYFNLDKIRTAHKLISIKRAEYELGRNALGQNPSSMGDKSAKYGMPARQVKLNPKGAVPPDFLDINTNCKSEDTTEHYASYPQNLISPLIRAGCPSKGIVLDPFMGSGTTAIVAKKLGCNYIGIELSLKYCEIIKKRLNQEIMNF